MVVVAQLVERQFVVLKVAGSSPVGHPHQVRVRPGLGRRLWASSRLLIQSNGYMRL